MKLQINAFWLIAFALFAGVIIGGYFGLGNSIQLSALQGFMALVGYFGIYLIRYYAENYKTG